VPVERLNDPSAWLEAARMDAQALLRAYSDATIAAAREEDAAGPHAETDPDVDRAWERVSNLRTLIGGYIVALEHHHLRNGGAA
jgi:hypothetical protein